MKPTEIAYRVTPRPIKDSVKALLDRVQRWSFRRQLRQGSPLIIYQMGKVGSSSIYESLKRHYNGPVFHAHSLSPRVAEKTHRWLHQWTVVEKQPARVISLTREPISRNISEFFQNLEVFIDESPANIQQSPEELQNTFLAKHWHDWSLNWFDTEINANFNIDVYEKAFPQTGTCQYSRENIELLVLRSELDDEDKITAICNFLSLDRFKLVNKNIGQQKEYSQTYKLFLENVRFPREYIDMICESKYFRHFYSTEEIAAARERWSA